MSPRAGIGATQARIKKGSVGTLPNDPETLRVVGDAPR
jgi:hypothetical protein